MKKSLLKIASISLAFLVLFSTLSFTVEKHYCGRFLVDVAVFSEAKGCGMEKMSHTETGESTLKKMSCCKDEVIVLEGQDELSVSLKLLDLSQQIFIIPFEFDYIALFSYEEQNEIIFKEYSPPDLVKDIPVLHESFLI